MMISHFTNKGNETEWRDCLPEVNMTRESDKDYRIWLSSLARGLCSLSPRLLPESSTLSGGSSPFFFFKLNQPKHPFLELSSFVLIHPLILRSLEKRNQKWIRMVGLVVQWKEHGARLLETVVISFPQFASYVTQSTFLLLSTFLIYQGG